MHALVMRHDMCDLSILISIQALLNAYLLSQQKNECNNILYRHRIFNRNLICFVINIFPSMPTV